MAGGLQEREHPGGSIDGGHQAWGGGRFRRQALSTLYHTELRRQYAVPSAPRLPITLNVNGEDVELFVPVHKTLLEVLREDMDLTGTKHGCELGECGACAVLIDSEPVLSCLALPIEHQAPARIVTIEGLSSSARPHPLQDTFAELGAAQCGYCTPGMLLTASALLEAVPSPSRDQIVEALSGNLCRCTGYVKIFEAVELAAERLRA
jgi:aerobic-type carbon monoxide dehydrogenase small subunit (CoxS/CutS family)